MRVSPSVLKKFTIISLRGSTAKHGPVEKSTYLEYRDFGTKNINRLVQVAQPFGGLSLFAQPEIVDKNFEAFFQRVFDIYGSCSGDKLAVFTRLDASPWKIMRDGCKPDFTGLCEDSDIVKYFNTFIKNNWLSMPQGLIIPKELMKIYFLH